MYHSFVRRMARRAFRQLSDGRLDEFLSVFGPGSVFCFAGDHALGGELHGAAAIRTFFERTFRLFPDIQIQPVTMVVRGWPWRTVMATRFAVGASLPDGSTYRNEGMQFLHLRWGKVVEDRLYEDTLALERALQLLASSGVEEAAAQPLGPLPTTSSLETRAATAAT